MSRRTGVIGVVIFSFIVVIAAVNYFFDTPQTKEEIASIENGEKLYNQLCLSCHGDNGKGEGNLTGTAINNQHFLSTFTNDDIYNMIETGKEVAMMPSYAYLEKKDKENLVSFFRSWQTKPLQLDAPSLIEGNAENGEKLYSLYCITCHGETGSGFQGASAAIAHPNTMELMTDRQMWISIAYGREETRMNASLKGLDGVRQLESQEISDIVEYIRHDLVKKYDPTEEGKKK